MRIVRVDCLTLQLRLKAPFQTTFSRLTEKETVLVRARTADGIAGYGEAPAFQSPWYSYESTDTVRATLERHIVPAVLGRELRSIQDLESCYGWIRGHNTAKSGIEAAYWHLRAQTENVPLRALWGGGAERIEVGISIGSAETVEGILEAVGAAQQAGYRRVKIKIRPGIDVEPVAAIRDTFGSIPLMVDCNAAYRLEDAATLKRLDRYDLLMLEQPLAPENLLGHARLQRELNTPVCLDESIDSRSAALQAIDLGAAKIINLKPSRLGGYWRAKTIAEEIKERGVPVWCGGMFETGIGKAFNIHLSSVPAFSLPGDTSGTDRYFVRDVLRDPIVVDSDSCIDVPVRAGIGYDIDEAAIEELTIARWTLRA